MLVTAVALFFSTFAGPMTADPADARRCGSPATSTPTCGTSRKSWTRRSPRGCARGVYYVLPNLAPFNVKAEVVHGVAVSGVARRRSRSRTRVGLHQRCCSSAAMAVFRRRRISSNVAARPAGLPASRLASPHRCCCGRRRAAGVARSRVDGVRAGDAGDVAAGGSGDRRARALGYRRAARRSLLDSRRRLFRPAAAVDAIRRRTTTCCIRCSISSPRSTRASWWRTASARFFSSEPPPDGPGRPDLAVALLERGVERNPERWEYLHDIGFVYYWHHRDYENGARVARARVARARRADLAEVDRGRRCTPSGGNRESARLLWRQIRDAARSRVDGRRSPTSAWRSSTRWMPSTSSTIVWRVQGGDRTAAARRGTELMAARRAARRPARSRRRAVRDRSGQRGSCACRRAIAALAAAADGHHA